MSGLEELDWIPIRILALDLTPRRSDLHFVP